MGNRENNWNLVMKYINRFDLKRVVDGESNSQVYLKSPIYARHHEAKLYIIFIWVDSIFNQPVKQVSRISGI